MDTFLDNATIGAFAQAAGVGVETIRFYQRKGLLPQPARRQGSVRRYGAADLARVRFVKTSQRLGWISEADVARTRALIRAAGLPDVAPDLGVDAYLEYMGHDKKVEGGKMRFVLLKKLGEAVITGDVPADVLTGVLSAPH